MKKNLGAVSHQLKVYYELRDIIDKAERKKQRETLRDYSEYWTTTPDIEIRWKK